MTGWPGRSLGHQASGVGSLRVDSLEVQIYSPHPLHGIPWHHLKIYQFTHPKVRVNFNVILHVNTVYIFYFRFQDTVTEQHGKYIIREELYELYTKSTSQPCSHVMFGSMLYKFFPTVTSSLVRIHKTPLRKKVYKGLFWKPSSESAASSQSLEDITHNLPRSSMIINKNDTLISFTVASHITTNGNIVQKLVTIYSDKTWILSIRGLPIDLSKLGICNTYCELSDLLTIVGKIQLCRGVQVRGNQVIPHSSVKEMISVVGDENSNAAHVRCHACTQVVAFSKKSGSDYTCSPCQRSLWSLDDLNNKEEVEDEDKVSLSIGDDKDMSVILEQVFPNAPAEMKDFLESQRSALKCSDSRGRRWSKQVIR